MPHRGMLEKVEPRVGDEALVLAFDDRRAYASAEYHRGEIVPPQSAPGDAEHGTCVAFATGGRGSQRVAYIHLQPDWAGQWPAGQVVYRETIPVPQVMDPVPGNAKEDHGWAVEMVLLGLHEAAEAIGAQTFDRHWLVCLRRAELRYEYYQEVEIYTPPDYQNRPGMLALAEPPQPQLRIMERRREVMAWHEDTARKRAWIRWEVGRGAWIQTGNPDALAILDRCRPR